MTRTKEIMKIFTGAGVPVVRMGLQASDMMDDPGQMLAGPWHPAFGHLVLSALMFDRACEQIDLAFERETKAGVPKTGTSLNVELRVHPRSLSRLKGDKKSNLDRLARQYPTAVLTVSTDKEMGMDAVTARIVN